MKNITENEMKFIMTILKNPEKELNASNIAKLIEMTSMGALKIARKLEKEGIIYSRQIGKSIIYKLTFNNSYTKQYVKFLLQREAEHSNAYIKRWINELKKIKNSKLIILFGSILIKHDNAKDVDILVVIDKRNFKKINEEISSINLMNNKKIHPVFQTEEDFRKNIEEDKVILNAIKGIVVSGEETFIELIEK